MYKRPHALASDFASSSSSADQSTPNAKQKRPLSSFSIFIIQAKIDPEEVSVLLRLSESLGANVNVSIEEADIIITSIRVLKRFERHISAKAALKKTVVGPLWLKDSAAQETCMPFGPYITIRALQYILPDSFPSHSPGPASSPKPLASSLQSSISFKARFATHRLSPLKCINQGLVDDFAVIMRWRFLEGEAQSELSYSKAIAVIKAYPQVIHSSKDVADLPGLGPKSLKMIDEYLNNGRIGETDRALNTPRFSSLSKFASIYGIGPATARRLYDDGNRTLDDLENYYQSVEKQTGKFSGIVEALRLRDDLSQKIPRSEVEEMAQAVLKILDSLQSGFQYTICGGYRRGKEFSNDVDVVFSRPSKDPKRDGGVCRGLVSKLESEGLVTHLLHISSFASHHSLFTHKASPNGFDLLDKAFTVFKLPGKGRVHRRLDLIFAPWELYWTAVVGWTGSKQFERDLRLWAKQSQGMKFDSSGIFRQDDSKPVFAKSEQEVFEILNLPWIDPIMRNADV